MRKFRIFFEQGYPNAFLDMAEDEIREKFRPSDFSINFVEGRWTGLVAEVKEEIHPYLDEEETVMFHPIGMMEFLSAIWPSPVEAGPLHLLIPELEVDWEW